jgi:hypothetical protein
MYYFLSPKDYWLVVTSTYVVPKNVASKNYFKSWKVKNITKLKLTYNNNNNWVKKDLVHNTLDSRKLDGCDWYWEEEGFPLSTELSKLTFKKKRAVPFNVSAQISYSSSNSMTLNW